MKTTFSMRTILVVIVFFALGLAAYRYLNPPPPPQVQKMHFGMTRAQVTDLFGEATDVRFGSEWETWRFNFEWGWMEVHFPQHENHCISYGYKRAE